MLSLPLYAFAMVYESNALAMALDEKDALTSSGYELSVQNGNEILYHDGVEVRRKVLTDGGYVITEQGEETVYQLDDENRIIGESRGEEVRRNNYSESGLLLSSSLSRGDEIIQFSSYYYDSDKNLVRVDSLTNSFIFNDDSFYFSDGGGEYMIQDDVNIVQTIGEGNVTRNDDGSVTVFEDDGVERTYSGNGRLLKAVEGDLITTYSYDEDGELAEERSVSSSSEIIRRYESSVLKEVEYLTDGILLRTVEYSDEGVQENRYQDGKLYAIISYDMDGRTIRNIRTFT